MEFGPKPPAAKIDNDAMWLKAEYARDNPGDLEGAELVGGMLKYVRDQVRLEKKAFATKLEAIEIVKKLTEFNFTWTHYVQSHKDDPHALRELQQRMEAAARKEGRNDLYMISRSGVMTQVATMEIFDKLGLRPSLSKPEEDTHRKIDLWIEEAPVQIKTNVDSDEVKIIETDTGAPLSVAIEKGNETAHFSPAEIEQASAFRLKLDKSAREFKKNQLRGFFLVLPKKHIDRTTGMPTDWLLQEVKKKLQALGYLPQAQEVKAA
jgi:hypothetical protein